MPEEITTATPIRHPVGGVKSIQEIEYIASSTEYPNFAMDIALPRSIDEVESRFGEGFYQKMIDTEPILEGVVKGVKAEVLSSGVTVTPSHEKPVEEEETPENVADWNEAEKAQKFIQFVLKDLEKRDMPFLGYLWSVLNAIYEGHKLTEKTRQTITYGEFKGKTGYKSLKTKPRVNYTLVVSTVDYEFRGVSAQVPGGPGVVWVGIVGDASENPWIVDPEKVAIFTIDRRDGDPRGRSWFRSAYVAYRAKQMQRPERAKTAAQFAGGFIHAVSPNGSDGKDYTHPETGEMASIQEITQWALKELSNGKASTFLNGTEVEVHTPEADPRFFQSENEAYDREMVTAVISHARAMLEAQHGAKNDSEQASDRADTVMAYVRSSLEAFVKTQIFYPIVKESYGEEFADKYTPNLTLSPAKSADLAANADAASKLGYSLDESQFPWFEEKFLGIKRREVTTQREQEVADDGSAGFPAVPGEEAEAPGSGRPGSRDGRPSVGSGKGAKQADGGRARVDARGLRQVDEGRAAKAARPQRKA